MAFSSVSLVLFLFADILLAILQDNSIAPYVGRKPIANQKILSRNILYSLLYCVIIILNLIRFKAKIFLQDMNNKEGLDMISSRYVNSNPSLSYHNLL